MKRKTAAIIILAALMSVTGCSGIPSSNSSVQETQHEDIDIDRYNAYIDVNNMMFNEIDGAIFSYYNYIGYQEDFMLLNTEYQGFRINSLDIVDEAYEIAQSTNPKEDIDNTYIALYPILNDLCVSLNKAYDYINSDTSANLSELAELHETIFKNTEKYLGISNTFTSYVTEMAEKQNAKDMEYFKNEGYEILYCLNLVLLTSDQIYTIIYEQEIYDENITELDSTEIVPLYERYIAETDQLFKLLDDADKLNHDGFTEDNPYLDAFEDLTKESINILNYIIEVAENGVSDFGNQFAGGAVSYYLQIISSMVQTYNFAVDY